MEQGIQDKLPLAALADSGCYFLSLLQWAVEDSGNDLNVPDILKLYRICIDDGIMKDDCFILDPCKVYKRAGGTHDYKNVTVWKQGKNITGDTYIVRLERPMYAHFILRYKGVDWDPLPPNRPAAKLYHEASYRVLI